MQSKCAKNFKLPKYGDPGLVQLIIRRQRLPLTVEGIYLGWRQAHLVHG